MFTGLIEAICTVRSVRPSAGGLALIIDLGTLAEQCKIGDSIAVNGVCLTVAGLQGNLATFELSGETLRKSALDRLKPASRANIERALMANGRFGGHIVQGHVDGTATIRAVKERGRFTDIGFAADPELLSQMVVKGSVAVDGISLTITEINESGFSTAIVPQTLQNTTLGTARIGDAVNIETDIIVKAVKKELQRILPEREALTAERLRDLGF
jgi:riboflavin synthase